MVIVCTRFGRKLGFESMDHYNAPFWNHFVASIRYVSETRHDLFEEVIAVSEASRNNVV